MLRLDHRIKTLESLQRENAVHFSDVEKLERLKSEEGYSLELIPGETLAEKVRAVNAAYWGELQLTPEARHAARGWLNMLEAV